MNRPAPDAGSTAWSILALVVLVATGGGLAHIGTPAPPPSAPAPHLVAPAEATPPAPLAPRPLPDSEHTAPVTDLLPAQPPAPDPEVYHDLEPDLHRDDDDHHHRRDEQRDRGRRHGHRIWEWLT